MSIIEDPSTPIDEAVRDVKLRDFTPEVQVRLPENLVPRMPVPAVDVHNHLGRWHFGNWSAPDVGALIGVMDGCNVEVIVNLDGCWGNELADNLARYDLAHPDRFATFCRLDWSDCATKGWGQRLAASLRTSVGRGAAGLKVWKDVGLRRRDENNQMFYLDDDRLEPIWEVAAEAGVPILVHTADPVAFFAPLDNHNERLEELIAHPEWHVRGDAYPTFERLLDALETTIAKHPNVPFIGAHVGCYAEDLSWVDRMLDTYPNFNVDIAARIAELGRQPRSARTLFLRHPNRILLGTDAFPPRPEDYAVYARFLTTADECFPYSDDSPPKTGRWTISALDLPAEVVTAVISHNARRLIPTLGER